MSPEKALHIVSMFKVSRLQEEMRKVPVIPADYFDAVEEAVHAFGLWRASEWAQEDADALVPFVIPEIGR